MSVEVRSNPGPESEEASLALFRFDDEGWLGLMRDAATPPADLGAVAGYRVLEEVGRGGQGVVFRAREESSGRIVALKRLAAGSLAGSEARARFRREIEAEAALRHPGIVGFQGVEVVEGQPLLVMEWIEGLPAARWARGMGGAEGRARPVREVLVAFARICDAVAYAHQRGVIHRDLKPSNILIDAAGEPHVLDFGLARLRPEGDAVGPEISRLTHTEGFVGTPAYAAPELLRPGAGGADVRADVYALGVVLYEMLAGRPPFEGGLESLLRAIGDEDPAPPSRHDRRIGGEADAIVLRAMAKEPARRYQSAHELGADVRRYLAGEAVEARRDSAWYVARKTLRRHRTVATAGALVMLSLAAGMAGTTFGLVRAESRRAEAERARQQTQKVSEFQAEMLSGLDAEAMGRSIKEGFREQVRAALERQYVGEPAERRRRTPEEVEAELQAYDQRADAAHTADVARRLMDQLVLARAAEALDGQFGDQPLVQAQLHHAIGSTYQSLGLSGPAEPHLRAALDIRRRELGPDDELVGITARDLAVLLGNPDRSAEALPLMREAVDIHLKHCPDECEKLADGLFNLSHMTEFTGDLAEAERLSRESLAMRRRLVGDRDSAVANGMNALARVVGKRGRHDEAETLNREALAIARAAHGDGDPMNARILNDLGTLFMARGDAAGAEPLFREAVEIERRLTGDWDALVPTMLLNHGMALERKGDHAEAARVYGDAVALRRRQSGDESTEVLYGLTRLGNVLRALGDLPGAEARWREALAIRRRLHAVNPDDGAFSAALGALGRALVQGGKHAEAEAILRESLVAGERVVPRDSPEYWHLANVRAMLGGAIAAQGAALIESDAPAAISRLVEAEALLLEAAGWLTSHADAIPEPPRTRRLREALGRVVKLYELWDTIEPGSGKAEKAALWRTDVEKFGGP